jgi:signal peptidase I
MNLSPLFRRIALLTISMVLAGLAGAAERPVSSVSFLDTLSDARSVAVRHSDMQVLRIAGRSMLPFFGEGSVVIIKKIDASLLREGMVVVYQNRLGETVAHRVVAATAAGWVVQGYNNTEADSTIVNSANLLGVVYATFHSNGNTDLGAGLAAIAGQTQIALAAPAQ